MDAGRGEGGEDMGPKGPKSSEGQRQAWGLTRRDRPCTPSDTGRESPSPPAPERCRSCSGDGFHQSSLAHPFGEGFSHALSTDRNGHLASFSFLKNKKSQ